MQSAGPIRQPWQPITFEFLLNGSEFGHWKVKGGQDAFAFRHPSLGKVHLPERDKTVFTSFQSATSGTEA